MIQVDRPGPHATPPELRAALDRVRRARTADTQRAAVRRLLYELKEQLRMPQQHRLTLIGLTGAAGAGKDTVAAYLRDAYGCPAVAFADALRIEVHDAFGHPDWSLFVDRVAKDLPIAQFALARATYAPFVARMRALELDLDKPRSPRKVLQLWGTEFRRAQQPGYWIARAEETISNLVRAGCAAIVVTDVRFPDEAARLRAHGGVIWRVDRRHSLADTHVSEHAMAGIQVDGVIHNDGTLTALELEVERVACPLLGGETAGASRQLA